MKKKPFFILILLISILVFLLLYSHAEFNNNDYPDSNYLFENYETFINTEIVFKAKVKTIDAANQTITANIEDPPYTVVEIHTTNIQTPLQKKDIIFIIGVMNGDKSVTAEKIFIQDPWNDYSIALCSVPAIPFVLYLFFRTWRFNRKTWLFERRHKNA